MSPATEPQPLPRFACLDWWEKIKAGETPMAQVPLNAERAAKALAFFNRLRLPDVLGNPPLSEACGDWFRDLLVAFLASEAPLTKRRLVVELLCMVPKKNSKTTYVAALGLTALYMEEAPERQMLIVAPTQNISERCFDQAQGMIRIDERLRAIFNVRDHLKSIERRKTGTKLDVKAFATDIITGEIPVLTIIDELHELGKKAKAAAVMQQIRGGGITKQGGQVLMITTQSDEAPAGIWKTELKKARAVRDGKGGDAPILLPLLYEFPQDLQRNQAFWRDQSKWPLLLPNLGLSIDKQRLIEDYQNNGRVNDEAEQIWASQHLNIEIGVGFGDNSWAGADYWQSAADLSLTLPELIRRSEVVTFGGDGGGLEDMLGIAVIGRERGTRKWLIWNRAWVHPKVLKKRPEIASQLRDFEQEGSLTICEASPMMTQVGQCFAEVLASGLLPEKNAVGLDPNNVAALIETLVANGMREGMLRRLIQGQALAPAWWGLELKLSEGTVSHSGLGLMDWCVSNARTVPHGNAIMITKQVSGRGKIDPLVATGEAAILMSWNPAAALKIDFASWLKQPAAVT